MSAHRGELVQHGRFALADGRAVYARIASGSAAVLDGPPWVGGTDTGEHITDIDPHGRTEHAVRLAPVTPSKIECVGRNYAAHARELGNEVPDEPLLFLKPPSSIIGPDGTIILPPQSLSERVEHEAELAVVVGARVRNATGQQAAEALFGFTIAADITARDLQRRDKTWTRGKALDTFCPVGPVVASGFDASALAIRCLVNGVERQRGSTADMVFAPTELIAYISSLMTLEPGDLILTGTPDGVGPLVDGDRLVITIAPIGTLELDVTA